MQIHDKVPLVVKFVMTALKHNDYTCSFIPHMFIRFMPT